MLDAMRKRASSWVVRVLLGLLIVSFAVWGIGDIFLGSQGGTVVAEVGDIEITAREVNRELDNQIQNLSAQFNTNIDRRQALAFGLLDQSVQREVARKLVDMHAKDLDLGVADDTVRTTITENPLYRSDAGFDRERLELVLRSQGLTEDSYIQQVKEELRRERIIGALSGLVEVPETMAAEIYRYRNEERSGTLLRIEASSIEVEDPDEDTLASYLAENQGAYEAPEYRSGALVIIDPSDIADEIDIGAAELQDAYEARLDGYTTPERRRVGQLLASDKAVIEKARDAIVEGATLADVAESMKDDGLSYSSIGPLAKGDLPSSLGDPIFAACRYRHIERPH